MFNKITKNILLISVIFSFLFITFSDSNNAYSMGNSSDNSGEIELLKTVIYY